MLTPFETTGIVVFLSIISIIISVFFIITYMNMKVNDKDHEEEIAYKYLEITGWTALCFSTLVLFSSFAVFSGKKDLTPIIDVSFYLMIILFVSLCCISLICFSYIYKGVNKDNNVKEYKTCFGIGIASFSMLILSIVIYSIYASKK